MSPVIPITISEVCWLPEVSPVGFYRWKTQALSPDSDMKLRDEIQRIALEFRYYGNRRVTPELSPTQPYSESRGEHLCLK
jgi:hypothetical protein